VDSDLRDAGHVAQHWSEVGDPTTTQVFPELTEREREVLDLMAAGHGNHEVARRLVLSEKTVCNHVSAILTELQAADPSAAIIRARDARLGRSS
jgi:DNA-binding NarL/FixJ family response regulator